LLGFFVLALVCSRAGDSPTAADATSSTVSTLALTATPANFRIFGSSFENSAKVVPPGVDSDCPTGAMAFNLGSRLRLLNRPLYTARGEVETGNVTRAQPFPPANQILVGTDNQMLRLPDGSLLVERDASVWRDISPPPAWFGETISGAGVEEQGNRGTPVFYRSTDCGRSWQLYSVMDVGTLAGGIYSIPRPANVDSNGNLIPDVGGCANQATRPDGRRYWWVGGVDRTEIYSDPFTGNLYMTTGVISGPFCTGPNDTSGFTKNVELVLFSGDQGLTWELITELQRQEPTVMTTTPDGRLYLLAFSCGPAGCAPTLYYTNAVGPGQKPTLIQPTTPPPSCDTRFPCGHPVFYEENGAQVPFSGVQSVDVDPVTGVQQTLRIFQPSLSRISTDRTTSKVRAEYHTVNANGMQESRVVRVEVEDGRPPLVKPIVAVRPEDTVNHSLLYFNFIDPDYLDMPADARSNSAMAYWIEVPKAGSTDFSIRHMFFEGDCRATTPRYLSVNLDGTPRKWQPRVDIGDYFSSGFWWAKGQLNYLAHWSEPFQNATFPGGLMAATTTSPFGLSQPDAHVWKQGLPQADFVSFDNLARADGWQTVDVKSFVLPAGEVRVDGVWHYENTPTGWIQGFTVSDFETALADFNAAGFRLETLSSFVLADGAVRVDALFRQNANVSAGWIQGYTVEDFLAENATRTSHGARLDHLQSFVLNDGGVRVDAVWHQEPGAWAFVQGFTVEDFIAEDTARRSAGWRIDHLQSFVLNDGGVRVDALWHQGPEQSTWIQGYTVEDFRSLESELRCQGWQLQKLSSFVLAGGGVRVDAVWHRNATPR
jgi:hypothetical protein